MQPKSLQTHTDTCTTTCRYFHMVLIVPHTWARAYAQLSKTQRNPCSRALSPSPQQHWHSALTIRTVLKYWIGMRQYWWLNECVRLNRQWRHSYIYRNTVGSHTWFCYLCHFLKSPNEPNTNTAKCRVSFSCVALSLCLFVFVNCSKCFAFAYTLLNFIDAIVETVLKISFTVSSALDKLL